MPTYLKRYAQVPPPPFHTRKTVVDCDKRNLKRTKINLIRGNVGVVRNCAIKSSVVGHTGHESRGGSSTQRMIIEMKRHCVSIITADAYAGRAAAMPVGREEKGTLEL